jgi:hypothetical protein
MSFLEDLREAEAQAQANAQITIAVPQSRFAVRFRPHPGGRDAMTGYIAAFARDGALSAEQELQLIVDLCGEILRRDDDTGDLGPYDRDEPLRFDAGDVRWHDDDGDGPKTARECVHRLYRLKDQPAAAAGTAETLIGWSQGLFNTAPARVEGKSESPET